MTQVPWDDSIPRRGLALVLLCVLLGAGALRVATRTVLEPGLGVMEGQAFGTFDPDAHYHMRRLERALASGGAIAGRDPLLTSSDLPGVEESSVGAPIPWPSGFTRLLWLGAAPFAPSEEGPERDGFVEVFVGSSAVVFGSLQALIAALAAALLVGGAGSLGAAALAGALVALAPAALRYSFLGMGDHHALASALILLSLLLLDRLLHRLREQQAPGSFVGPALAASLSLACAISIWLPSLAVAGLGALFLGNAVLRTPCGSPLGPQTARAALLYFFSLALFLVPLGWTSPWPPMALLEPSWMQAVLSACLGLPFLGWAPNRPRPLVLGGIVGLALALLILVGVPGEVQLGLGRGLDWLRARDLFMGTIGESRPPGFALPSWTGPGLLIAAVGLVFPRRQGLLLWRVAFAGALVAGCLQVRFTESLVPLMAVLAGVVFGSLSLASKRPFRGVVAVWLVALAVHGWLPGQAPRWTMSPSSSDAESTTLTSHRSIREACIWLRNQPDPGAEWAVLAQWDLGHGIEWLSRRRTLASNFGAYLGQEAFLVPWKALVSQNDDALRELLTQERVSHLMVNSRWRRNQDPMMRLLGLEEIPESSLIKRLEGFSSVPGFLRLVHQSPVELFDRVHEYDVQPQPGTRIFEVVRGATLEVQGNPGEVLQVALPLITPDGQRLLHRVRAEVGNDGKGRVLMPYSTQSAGAGGLGGETLRWSCGLLRGTATVTEEDIQEGRLVQLVQDP